MPLHDWSDDSGWHIVHHCWITELLRWIKQRLPAGYRAFIGTAPGLAVEVPGNPDVGVSNGPPRHGSPSAPVDPGSVPEEEYLRPEEEVLVATAITDRVPFVFVERKGWMVAAVEVISPANKERPAERASSVTRYAAYLLNCVNLMVIDLLPRPRNFSFADAIAAELNLPDQRPLPTPFAISYLIGTQATDHGRHLGIWRRRLEVGTPLPAISLPLNVREEVQIDLEATYMRAAADAYLE